MAIVDIPAVNHLQREVSLARRHAECRASEAHGAPATARVMLYADLNVDHSTAMMAALRPMVTV